MLLAIDTSTRMVSLALHEGHRVRSEIVWESVNRHTVEVTPAIQDLCQRAGITLSAVTHVAVAQGPGSFSGLRIGIGVAKGLAMSLNRPLIAIPTLDIVAFGLLPIHPYPLIAVAQAGRSRVCVGRYRWDGQQWVSTHSLVISEWDALLAGIESPVYLLGEIDPEIYPRLETHPGLIHCPPRSFHVRRAAHLAELAWRRIHSDPTASFSPAEIRPIYVNPPGQSSP
jgi:tRNA threonylcarbamoyladenosine biosynthesis protein TsaB